MIKSIIMRWAGHVACMVERRGAHGIWMGNMENRDHMEDEGVDRTVILKWI
jgi:hypothetical protein